MIWIVAKLIGIGSWLKQAATAALGLVTRYPLQCALIAALCLSAWLWRGKHHAQAELAAIHAAQKTAGAAQAAVNHEPARVSGIIASNSDAQAPAYYDAVRRAAADHAVSLRGKGLSCPARLPGADSAVEGVHGPDTLADVVPLAQGDYDQLVYAAARAAQMHAESLELIAAGVAVASDPASAASETPPGP